VVGAATKFLDAWLVKRDFNGASAYLSPKCADCVKLNPYASEQQPGPAEDDPHTQLKAALRRVSVTAGVVKRLDKAIVAAEPNHEDIKLVKHDNSNAFALVAIPDYMASALDCSSRVPGQPVGFIAPAGEKSYGKYYAIGLRLAKAGEDSAVLWAVWAREDAAWKIVSYTVLSP
jgi:hypothetical protein